MKVSVSTIAPAELDVDILIVPTPEDKKGEVGSILGLTGKSSDAAIADFSGKLGEVAVLYPEKKFQAPRVCLVGLGDSESVTTESLRRAAAASSPSTAKSGIETVGIVVPECSEGAEAAGEALAVGFMLGHYRFDTYLTSNDTPKSLPARLVLQSSEADKQVRVGAERGKVISDAVAFARDLVNASPNHMTATLLSKAAEQSGKKNGFSAVTWDKAMIAEEGMGGLLAVNQGSVEPPTFSVLEWRPDNAANERPIVLVGKGVVFDTGGLSLKPTKNSMDHMKCDMAGAAAVIATFQALARLEVPLYVVGLVPATDNRPGVNAYVPGDVIKMHSGKTVEVLNTDAEGRMLLADALSYASSYRPEIVIDLATLTGSAVVALGEYVAAVMTNETDGAAERLDQMIRAGRNSGDRVHSLPMFADYAEQLKSNVADLKNVGNKGAGSITAAKFLEHFVNYPWVHLDIAGPAFLDSASGYRAAGGTGFGVYLLVNYLLSRTSGRKGR